VSNRPGIACGIASSDPLRPWLRGIVDMFPVYSRIYRTAYLGLYVSRVEGRQR